jgi:hypothetical protein
VLLLVLAGLGSGQRPRPGGVAFGFVDAGGGTPDREVVPGRAGRAEVQVKPGCAVSHWVMAGSCRSTAVAAEGRLSRPGRQLGLRPPRPRQSQFYDLPTSPDAQISAGLLTARPS